MLGVGCHYLKSQGDFNSDLGQVLTAGCLKDVGPLSRWSPYSSLVLRLEATLGLLFFSNHSISFVFLSSQNIITFRNLSRLENCSLCTSQRHRTWSAQPKSFTGLGHWSLGLVPRQCIKDVDGCCNGKIINLAWLDRPTRGWTLCRSLFPI